MSQHQPSEMDFGDVLPEQTSDDVEHPSERDDGEVELQRFLDDKPPHHVD